ncbi:hypothetical protein [Gordonia lacunae]|uniref:Polysaccharide chain length determinant N-terminal domain-containing protein n=1 Tax=Gordonia lacunae TaxID=417102 RepID=A0A243QDL1_9ACTN|nr:hypothetical protein [Gordonia lacunae]OUC79831.1 hypothetical protein CA982_05880 [Gordonia lacunae]
MTSSFDAAGRRDAPPSVDLFGHFRDLVRVAVPAILIGILVGASVFALRTALVAEEYSATVVAEITPAGTIIPGDAFVEQLRAPFVALSTDENVLRQVLTQVDTGWSTSELSSHVTTTPGTAPTLMDFTATAPTSEQAEDVVRAMVTAISAASLSTHARDITRQIDQLRAQVTAERVRNRALPDRSDAKVESDATLADLDSQLTRLQNSSSDTLTILAAPSVSEVPVAPKPAQEAAVAGIAATIVAAELLVLFRGRVGRRPNPIWARRVAHRYGAQLTYGRRGEPALPSTLLPAFAQRHRRAQTAVILTGEHVDADRLIGDLVPPTDDALNGHRLRVARHSITEAWWQRVDPGDLALAVVVVSSSGRDRKAAEQALSQLATIGATRHLIVQRTGKQPPAPALSSPADVVPDDSAGVESAGDTAAPRTEAATPMTPAAAHDDPGTNPVDPDRFRAAPGDVGSNAR